MPRAMDEAASALLTSEVRKLAVPLARLAALRACSSSRLSSVSRVTPLELSSGKGMRCVLSASRRSLSAPAWVEVRATVNGKVAWMAMFRSMFEW